jgi:xanthine/uracil permease
MSDSYLPRWRKVTASAGAIVAPDERLAWPQTAAMGVQHVIAMFGATVLAPILMGFNPNIAILMSGIGTLIFFFITGGRVPSYLGSSFAFIGVVIAASGYAVTEPNTNLGVALGGIIVCGAIYALIGVLVALTNERHTKRAPVRGLEGIEVEEVELDVAVHWIERLMPPVVTGAVVAVIGLNLASVPIKNMAPTGFDTWIQALTFLCVGLIAVYTRGMIQRLLILMGLIAASVIYAVLTNGLGLGKPIDFAPLAAAAWFGLPTFTSPVF